MVFRGYPRLNHNHNIALPRTQRGRSLANCCQLANFKSYVCGNISTAFEVWRNISTVFMFAGTYQYHFFSFPAGSIPRWSENSGL